MKLDVFMLLFVTVFVTFVTLGGWKHSMKLTSYFAKKPATATTKAFWLPRCWKPWATRRAWSRWGWTAGATVTSSRKSLSGAGGIRSKQPNLGPLAKCA